MPDRVTQHADIEIPKTNSERIYVLFVLAIRHHALSTVLFAVLFGIMLLKGLPLAEKAIESNVMQAEAVKQQAQSNFALAKAVEDATASDPMNRQAFMTLAKAIEGNAEQWERVLREIFKRE